MPKLDSIRANSKQVRPRLPDEAVNEIIQTVRSNPDANKAELARLYGCSENTIYKIIRKGKEQYGDKFYLTDERKKTHKERVLELFKDSEEFISTNQAGKALGIKPNRVAEIIYQLERDGHSFKRVQDGMCRKYKYQVNEEKESNSNFQSALAAWGRD